MTKKDNNEDYPLSEEDKVFAFKVISELDIQYDQVFFLIRKFAQIRQVTLLDWIQQSGELNLDFYREIVNKVFEPEVNIQEIRIITNKGTIKIESNTTYFPFFSNALKKIELNCKANINYKPSSSRELKFNRFVSYLILSDIYNLNNISDFKKCVLGGLVIKHFKLDKHNSIMTENEFRINRTDSAQDYKHYLNDIVKSRFKAYNKT